MRIPPALLVPLAIACTTLDGPAGAENWRDLWRQQAPRHYQMDQDVLCFCIPPRSVRIEVQDDAIVTVTDRENGAAVPSSRWQGFYTVERLFDLIAEARQRNAVQLDVTYHPTDNYPTAISIDYKTTVADDELTIRVTALTAMP